MKKERYEIYKPILAIGFCYPDGQWLPGKILLNYRDAPELNPDEVTFKIISIDPTERFELTNTPNYENPIGFTGRVRTDFPEALYDLELYISNQYPLPVGGPFRELMDEHWRLRTNSDVAMTPLLIENKIPCGYDRLGLFLNLLETSLNRYEKWKSFYDRIIKEIADNFTAWEVKKVPIIEGVWEDVCYTVVELNPNIDQAGNDGCSHGPTSKLPGHGNTIKGITVCDGHPDKLAIKSIVGESDSFSCEYIYMCQECVDKHDEHEEQRDFSGFCDWCKEYKPYVSPHRDFEEGSSGPVYDVCSDCRDAEQKRIREEHGQDDDDWDDSTEW